MSGDERVHERLEVGAPPLREAVADLPVVVDPVRRVELDRALGRREPVVEPRLQPVDLVLARLEVVARPARPIASRWSGMGAARQGARVKKPEVVIGRP